MENRREQPQRVSDLTANPTQESWLPAPLMCVRLPLQENSRRQKQHLSQRFDSLYSTLEERKKELVQRVSREQEERVSHVRSLIRQYGEHLEISAKLVESAIQAMEEPQMAAYLQVCAGRGVSGKGRRTDGYSPAQLQ
uniref:Uncharacterized protein n=1 Tax=Terrapene triunguis TaxID=2587831 RepID=A0A674J7Z3_9SAUR